MIKTKNELQTKSIYYIEYIPNCVHIETRELIVKIFCSLVGLNDREREKERKMFKRASEWKKNTQIEWD